MRAVPTTGLVIEKMRKMESSSTGSSLPTSSRPTVSVKTTFPCRASMVTTPASLPSSTIACMPASSRSRRLAETPTDAGSATARSRAASALAAAGTACSDW